MKPDRIVADGKHIELGGVNLTAHLTPGHTKGCVSWSATATEDGKDYNVLILCGLTASLYKLTNNEQYPNIVDDARRTYNACGECTLMFCSRRMVSGLISKAKLHARNRALPILSWIRVSSTGT